MSITGYGRVADSHFSRLICIYETEIIGTLLFMSAAALSGRDLIEKNYINYINYIPGGKLNLN